MPVCENCGYRTDREVKFCVKCGSAFSQNDLPDTDVELSGLGTEDPSQTETPKNQCLNCGHENPQENNFCINCGKDLDTPDRTPDYDATPSNDSLEETLSELKHIEFSLSQVTNLDDLLSRQFFSRLELRKVTLLENL